MKKTIVSIVAAVVLVLSLGIMAGCGKGGGNYSETFKGAVSEETYVSTDDAVKGFLKTEISGKTTEAVFVGYEKEKELTPTEVNNLGIDKEYRDGLISVEMGEVEYSEEKTSTGYASALASALSPAPVLTQTRTIYILTYTDVFRFFVPATKTGDTITASYFDSTFDGASYVNCTMEVEMTAEGSQSGMKYTRTQTALAKVTQTALYEKDTVSATINGTAIPDGMVNGFEAYYIDTTDGIYGARKDSSDTSWEVSAGASSSYENINEYFMLWFEGRFGALDHTYFEKTSTGYALRADRYNEYIKSQNMNIEGDFDLSYVINIAEGRFSDVTMKISYSGNSTTMKIAFKDFGSTKIEIPAEVQAQLPKA